MKNYDLTPEEVFKRVARLCAKSEKCTSEIRRKVAAYGLDEADTEMVIDWLLEGKFVDDERYARAFVRDKYRFQHWGRSRINSELRRRRISPLIIRDAFDEIEQDDYEAIAARLITAKMRSLGEEADTYKGRCKIFRFALGKGFESDLIRRVLDNLPDD